MAERARISLSIGGSERRARRNRYDYTLALLSPSGASSRFDDEHRNVTNWNGLGEHLDTSQREFPRRLSATGFVPTSAVAAAFVLALTLGAPAAYAEDNTSPDAGPVVVAPTATESPTATPVPSDPAPIPTDTTPAQPPAPEPSVPSIPVPPPAPEVPPAIVVVPPVVVDPVPVPVVPVPTTAAPVVPALPEPTQEAPEPSPEPTTEPTSTPSPTATPTKPSATRPTASTAAPKAGNGIPTEAVAATGSPFIVQLLTVLALLGAGFAYFRALGSKGTRPASRSGK